LSQIDGLGPHAALQLVGEIGTDMSRWPSPSFRPTAEIVVLRTYLRQRASLVEEAGSHIQRMQKSLTQMNLMLHLVLSDITGATGLKIVRSILDGERDPARLAAHRDRRCHASIQEIIAALTGNYRAEHLFTLKQNFNAYAARVMINKQVRSLTSR
jgi:transposase